MNNKTEKKRNEFDPTKPVGGKKITVVFAAGETLVATRSITLSERGPASD